MCKKNTCLNHFKHLLVEYIDKCIKCLQANKTDAIHTTLTQKNCTIYTIPSKYTKCICKVKVLPYFWLLNNSTFDENKYLMYKYKLSHNDWYIGVINICSKIRPKSVFMCLCSSFRKHGISYYNPHLPQWSTHYIPLEAAIKDKCRVLLYVITDDTRAITSMLEVSKNYIAVVLKK